MRSNAQSVDWHGLAQKTFSNPKAAPHGEKATQEAEPTWLDFPATGGRSFEPLEARMLLSGNPVATNDTYTASNNGNTAIPAAYGVLANDTDPNHLPLTAVLETNPSHGRVSLAANGGLTYTPATHFIGSDSFTHVASNGGESSAPATVSVTVTDQAPQPTNDGQL